ncbi:formyltransferase family protein [Pseudomonas fluorescens]|uniref:formyltransferase family protein n=1 Tax=Pseudomonas fluorescens TaxID=294 RepID=UPI0009BB664C|nr:formyltransferase family protein [Pseudomonas fluorescens]
MNKTLVFLCSGGGGNLRFILNSIRNKWISRWANVVVIADRECPAIDFARKEGLANFVIDFKGLEQSSLIRLMLSFEPDLVITTVHRILSNPFLEAFEGRLLNLHYSLLPAFPGSIGATPVQAALNYGSRLIGATVHVVTETVDAGQPQVQIALPVTHKDALEDAMDLVFRAGCIALLTALRIIDKPNAVSSIGGQIVINSRVALLSPFTPPPEELSNSDFWETLR